MSLVGISTEVNLDEWRLSLGRVSASMVLGGLSPHLTPQETR
jgi:hypothetical protein